MRTWSGSFRRAIFPVYGPFAGVLMQFIDCLIRHQQSTAKKASDVCLYSRNRRRILGKMREQEN
jgi:hypothetical protein